MDLNAELAENILTKRPWQLSGEANQKHMLWVLIPPPPLPLKKKKKKKKNVEQSSYYDRDFPLIVRNEWTNYACSRNEIEVDGQTLLSHPATSHRHRAS